VSYVGDALERICVGCVRGMEGTSERRTVVEKVQKVQGIANGQKLHIHLEVDSKPCNGDRYDMSY